MSAPAKTCQSSRKGDGWLEIRLANYSFLCLGPEYWLGNWCNEVQKELNTNFRAVTGKASIQQRVLFTRLISLEFRSTLRNLQTQNGKEIDTGAAVRCFYMRPTNRRQGISLNNKTTIKQDSFQNKRATCDFSIWKMIYLDAWEKGDLLSEEKQNKNTSDDLKHLSEGPKSLMTLRINSKELKCLCCH